MSAPAPYPRMLYADSGATMIVPNAEAEQAAGAGWKPEPSDVHRAPSGFIPQPLPSGQDGLIEAVAQRTAQLVLEALKEAPPPPELPEMATTPARRPKP